MTKLNKKELCNCGKYAGFHELNLHKELKQLKKNDTITIIGRRWFEKTNGNTYHSVSVSVNGELIERVGFAYGYDNSYTQTARAILEKYYKLPLAKYQAIWNLRDNGINIVDSVSDVARKKDL
jgi:hypothetical protein